MKPQEMIRLVRDLIETDYIASMVGEGRPAEDLIQEIRDCLETYDTERHFEEAGESQ